MLGAVSSNSASVWSRVAGEHDVSIRYSKSSNFTEFEETPSIRSLAENDYCVTQTIEGLTPGTYYHYQVLVDGIVHQVPNQRGSDSLLTAPTESMQPRFNIAFGSGANTDEDGLQAIWLQVQNARPHAFFWLGEKDSAETALPPAFQAEKYRQQRNVPFLQPLLRAIPQISAWDGAATPDAMDTFQRYWANPEAAANTTYFTYNYAGVDFFFLDTSSYSDDETTLLGANQLAWLKSELEQSNGKFKILLSSKSWTNAASDDSKNWLNYKAERDGLFAFIGEEEIPGVMLISGSDQQAEINAIPLSQDGHYDLYEMTSSPLAQTPASDYSYDDTSSISIQEPYADSMNFGLLSFDMTFEDPSVEFQIINVFGESVFPEFQVHASELSKGIASWKSKQDPTSVAFTK